MTDVWQGLVIVGMGNPLLTDDGVGHHATRALAIAFPGAAVQTIPMVGMDLLDIVEGYQTLCLVDAVTTGADPIGTVGRLPLPAPGLHGCSSHGPDLQSVLALGQHLGIDIPRTILLYGIEIGLALAYGENLTPALRECFDAAINEIAADMKRFLTPLYPHA